MAEQRDDLDGAADSGEGTMSEGIGGLPDIDDGERATIGDVDGDNIQDGEELD